MSGFEKPNYTQTPNFLFDSLMAEMGNAELRVVLAVCRKTFGWHKQRDRISLSQMVKLTGMTRESVISGVSAAINRGVISRYPAGNSFEYEIVVVGEADQQGDENSRATEPELVGLPDTQKKQRKQKKLNSPYRVKNQPPEEVPSWALNERLAQERNRALAEVGSSSSNVRE